MRVMSKAPKNKIPIEDSYEIQKCTKLDAKATQSAFRTCILFSFFVGVICLIIGAILLGMALGSPQQEFETAGQWIQRQ